MHAEAIPESQRANELTGAAGNINLQTPNGT